MPDTREELTELVAELLAKGTPLMAERKVALARELSAMVARNPSGQTAAWPVVESVQENGVCAEATAPGVSVRPLSFYDAVARRLAGERMVS